MKPSMELLYQAWAEEPRKEASQAREDLERALSIDSEDKQCKLYHYEELIMKEAFESGFRTARELLG